MPFIWMGEIVPRPNIGASLGAGISEGLRVGMDRAYLEKMQREEHMRNLAQAVYSIYMSADDETRKAIASNPKAIELMKKYMPSLVSPSEEVIAPPSIEAQERQIKFNILRDYWDRMMERERLVRGAIREIPIVPPSAPAFTPLPKLQVPTLGAERERASPTLAPGTKLDIPQITPFQPTLSREQLGPDVVAVRRFLEELPPSSRAVAMLALQDWATTGDLSPLTGLLPKSDLKVVPEGSYVIDSLGNVVHLPKSGDDDLQKWMLKWSLKRGEDITGEVATKVKRWTDMKGQFATSPMGSVNPVALLQIIIADYKATADHWGKDPARVQNLVPITGYVTDDIVSFVTSNKGKVSPSVLQGLLDDHHQITSGVVYIDDKPVSVIDRATLMDQDTKLRNAGYIQIRYPVRDKDGKVVGLASRWAVDVDTAKSILDEELQRGTITPSDYQNAIRLLPDRRGILRRVLGIFGGE